MNKTVKKISFTALFAAMAHQPGKEGGYNP